MLVINQAIQEGDVNTAKWYAERKRKQEFSLRQEITGEDGEPIKMQVPEIVVNFVKKNEDRKFQI